MQINVVKYILYVEDEEALLYFVKRRVEEEIPSIECLTATNVSQALDILKVHDVALVITDIQMPGQTGLTLLEKTKNFKAKLPVIVFSGDIKKAAYQEVLKKADIVLEKTSHIEELIAAVKKLLS